MDAHDPVSLDHAHCWHPFTRQQEWTQEPPLMLTHGQGVWLFDTQGNRYFDGNSSIWTNIHGHAHPTINRAITAQLEKVAHTSFLGFSHPPAAELAARLCSYFPKNTLTRAFFSDNGSTAVECAIRMALQYRQQSGETQRTEFLAFENAYHGDTLGAFSLGGVSRFTQNLAQSGLTVHRAHSLQSLDSIPNLDPSRLAAVIIEPLIQGVNEMHTWPPGMLAQLRSWTHQHGIHLILDEVMTGFGRTAKRFACDHEHVIPDFLCLAKGLTGGYLPLAATLTTETIYNAFLGSPQRTFSYGHSYTANPLGCAAALASLTLLDQLLPSLPEKSLWLTTELHQLQQTFPHLIHQTRQCGLIAGIQLTPPPNAREISPHKPWGEFLCLQARQHGLLTRPILNTIPLLPPLSSTREELTFAFQALHSTLQKFS